MLPSFVSLIVGKADSSAPLVCDRQPLLIGSEAIRSSSCAFVDFTINNEMAIKVNVIFFISFYF